MVMLQTMSSPAPLTQSGPLQNVSQCSTRSEGLNVLRDGGRGLSQNRLRCGDRHSGLEPFLDAQAYAHVLFNLHHLVLLCLASFCTSEDGRIEVQHKTTRHDGELFLSGQCRVVGGQRPT